MMSDKGCRKIEGYSKEKEFFLDTFLLGVSWDARWRQQNKELIQGRKDGKTQTKCRGHSR